MARIEPFEKYSEKYEDWFERNEFVYKSEIQAIKGLLPKTKKGIEMGWERAYILIMRSTMKMRKNELVVK